MKLTSLPVIALALAGTTLAGPAPRKEALVNPRSTVTVHESEVVATTTVWATLYSTRKPAMSTEGCPSVATTTVWSTFYLTRNPTEECTPVTTVTVTETAHLLEGPTATLRSTPTALPGSIMQHLDGLPSTYKHCFHVEEETSKNVSDYHHLKYTWGVETWCQGGKYLEGNGGRSFASWLENNIVPCVRTFSGEPSSADRTQAKNWMEFHCGAKAWADPTSTKSWYDVA